MLNNTKFAREAERERGGGLFSRRGAGVAKRGNTWDIYGSAMWVNFGLDADTSGKEEGRLAQKKLAKGKE